MYVLEWVIYHKSWPNICPSISLKRKLHATQYLFTLNIFFINKPNHLFVGSTRFNNCTNCLTLSDKTVFFLKFWRRYKVCQRKYVSLMLNIAYGSAGNNVLFHEVFWLASVAKLFNQVNNPDGSNLKSDILFSLKRLGDFV